MNDQLHVVFFKGHQLTNKKLKQKELIKLDNNYKRISLQDLHEMIYLSEYDEKNKKELINITTDMIKSFFNKNINVIIDDITTDDVFEKHLNENLKESSKTLGKNIIIDVNYFKFDKNYAISLNNRSHNKVSEDYITKIYEEYSNLDIKNKHYYITANSK